MLYHDRDVKFFRTRRRVLVVFFALFLVFTFLAVIKLLYFSKQEIPLDRTYADIVKSLRKVAIVTDRGETPLLLEVADTPEKRSQGLMLRRNLAKNSGMLFVFPEDAKDGFWMKNTLIALDILFVDASGTIVDFASMDPCIEDPCTVYASQFPYRYALEVYQGFIRDNQIKRGDPVRL